MRFRGLIVCALLSSVACDDAVQVAAPTAPPMASEGARAFIVQEPGATPDRVTLTIHVDSKGLGVAAYQGRLEFDAGAFEIIEATVPSDGSRLVNADAGPGQIRFGGFSAEQFANTAAVKLIVRPLRALESANLTVSLDVVGEASGVSVAKDKLFTQRGIFKAGAIQ